MAPENGINTLEVPLDHLVYFQHYTYTCEKGYRTADPLVTVCQPNGTLSLTRPPECTGENVRTAIYIFGLIVSARLNNYKTQFTY